VVPAYMISLTVRKQKGVWVHAAPYISPVPNSLSSNFLRRKRLFLQLRLDEK
jgi:hypothetical protein